GTRGVGQHRLRSPAKALGRSELGPLELASLRSYGAFVRECEHSLYTKSNNPDEPALPRADRGSRNSRGFFLEVVQKNPATRGRGFVAGSVLQCSLRRRENPTPKRATPMSAIVAGSGTPPVTTMILWLMASEYAAALATAT